MVNKNHYQTYLIWWSCWFQETPNCHFNFRSIVFIGKHLHRLSWICIQLYVNVSKIWNISQHFCIRVELSVDAYIRAFIFEWQKKTQLSSYTWLWLCHICKTMQTTINQLESMNFKNWTQFELEWKMRNSLNELFSVNRLKFPDYVYFWIVFFSFRQQFGCAIHFRWLPIYTNVHTDRGIFYRCLCWMVFERQRSEIKH